ncbi:hypothetical protein WN944_019924 [Citrus x changshan-huyou]|uniref:Glyoxal oxidase N-terminal domain-containing protein n=1 Tax=Citrus x changshan-huyou TaxID=2935761 RepID=A0AAP0LX63_9ROSI
MFDRTNFGPLNIYLPKNCTCQTNDDVEKQDCTAHSILYDIISNTFRPLMVKTDTWCSSRFIDKIWHPVQSSSYHGEDHAIYLFTLYNNDSGCAGLSSMVILQIGGDTLPANFYPTISDDKQTYPSIGSSVLLHLHGNDLQAKSMETMSMPHVIPDMLLLPTSDVILINGANHGTVGWNDTKHSNFNQVLYSPNEEPT